MDEHDQRPPGAAPAGTRVPAPDLPPAATDDLEVFVEPPPRAAERWLAWAERHARWLVLGVAAVVLAAGLVYSLALGERLRYYDEQVYLTLADNVVHHGEYSFDGVEPSAYRPPGYPLLLVPLRWLGVGVVGLRALNMLALAVTVVAVAALAERLAGRLAAVLAAVFTAGYPLFMYSAGTLYPQTLAALQLAGGILLIAWALEAGGTRRRCLLAAAGGLVFGTLVLSVPTFAVSFAAVLAWVVLRARRGAALLLACALPAAALLPAAWTVRNAAELHAFVPVSTNNGVNLLLGNSEHATAGGGRVIDISRYEDQASRLGLDEVERDAFYRDAAIEWIRSHPARALGLYAGKLVNNFHVRNELATKGQATALTTVLLAVTYLPLLVLAALRLWSWRGRRPGSLEVLLVALILGNALVLAVYYTRIRFRIPLDALVIVLAAGYLATRVREKLAPAD